MAQRFNYNANPSEGLKILYEMEKVINHSSISKTIRELIKIRASQINKCAFCLNMHTAEARKLGETEQRLYCLSAWEECDFYTDEEKAALELTEHITLISNHGVPDSLYQHVRTFFSEEQYFELIIIIGQINTWNRISIAMGNTAK
ncbi:carboxymuconolactone decarboxylase family protein [Paenibacillus agilis]|uniref:Carboxymuconolactone decarboxylase family protein n=1 Tax=Paenibacillus agilis TaxID=3020863 RepID=A0A559J0E2_9BACL|nr:carboxymuconolactone decarboxylase family protein [Paenibacillus agilis]TVX93359.1 carboxymuconolactone decarboxylase family protein [Paenibacillus agilis]